MNVLITGGAGFVGSHLAEALLGQGQQVCVLDDVSTGREFKISHLMNDPRFRFVKGSVLDVARMSSLIERSDVIYHLAAIVGVENVIANPRAVLDVNIIGTYNVLRLAEKHGRKVLFSSSSEVYGRNPNVPYKEDDDRVLGSTKVDRWCYSTSKAVGEHFCFAYKKMGLPMVIVRYFNVYGPRLDDFQSGRVMTIFMRQLANHEPLTVIGDGMQTRCFTYIDDAVRGTILAAESGAAEGQVFNIGTDEEVSIYHLAAIMRRVFGSEVEIIHVSQESLYGSGHEDIQRRVPSIEKARELLGFQPQVSLEEGLRLTIPWFMENYEKHGTRSRATT